MTPDIGNIGKMSSTIPPPRITIRGLLPSHVMSYTDTFMPMGRHTIRPSSCDLFRVMTILPCHPPYTATA